MTGCGGLNCLKGLAGGEGAGLNKDDTHLRGRSAYYLRLGPGQNWLVITTLSLPDIDTVNGQPIG